MIRRMRFFRVRRSGRRDKCGAGGSAPVGPRVAHELLRRYPPGTEADAHGAADGTEAEGRRGAVQIMRGILTVVEDMG